MMPVRRAHPIGVITVEPMTRRWPRRLRRRQQFCAPVTTNDYIRGLAMSQRSDRANIFRHSCRSHAVLVPVSADDHEFLHAHPLPGIVMNAGNVLLSAEARIQPPSHQRTVRGQASEESGSGPRVRQRLGQIAGPVSVESRFEACSDLLTFFRRDLGLAAVGVVDRQAAGGGAEDRVGPR